MFEICSCILIGGIFEYNNQLKIILTLNFVVYYIENIINKKKHKKDKWLLGCNLKVCQHEWNGLTLH